MMMMLMRTILAKNVTMVMIDGDDNDNEDDDIHDNSLCRKMVMTIIMR